jgi:hypothetical protein
MGLLNDSKEGEHSGGSLAVEAPNRGKRKFRSAIAAAAPFPFSRRGAMSETLSGERHG